MGSKRTCILAGALAAILCAGGSASAEPLPGPMTIWKFLGIPQNYQKNRDARVNRNGNNPDRERKDPVKRIADPENLKSDNPAIKAAAEVKTEEDLAPQKIKAIKYLATIGCGCYPEVKKALLAALDDCTEAVRYQAAVAFCRASGDPCTVCNNATCCDPEVQKKLRDKAYGMDEKGCWKEPSARVRAAAELALNACEAVAGPTPTEVEKPKELPTERGLVPPEPPGGADRQSGWIDVEGAGSGARVRQTALAGPGAQDNAAGVSGAEAAGTEATLAAFGRRARRCPPCPCPTVPGAPEEAAEPAAPGEAPELGPMPAPTDLAGTFGAAAGPQSVAPYMIGDFFGGSTHRAVVVQRNIRQFAFGNLGFEAATPGAFFTTQGATRVALNSLVENGQGAFPILAVNDASGALGGLPLAQVPAGGIFLDGTTTEDYEHQDYDSRFRVAYDTVYVVNVPSPGSGGGVGRLKIGDNTSPMPRDRLIFDYSYFDDVPLWPGGVHVNRFTLGFEKTFLDGLASFELKAPMATTLNSTVTADGPTALDHGEFGNLSCTVKGLFLRRETWAFSSGLQVGVPTGDDTRVILTDGTPLVLVRNDSVHLGPFGALLWTPNDRLFAQGFLQFDFDPNGNAVFLNRNGGGMAHVGRLNDPHFMYLDLGIGYWTVRSDRPSDCLTGVAWTAELHWNRSLQDPDAVVDGNWVIGDFGGAIEIVDLTLGAHLELYRNTLVTLAYAMPLGGGSDAQFDGEFRVMLNHHFGRSNRANRAPLSL